MKKKFLETIIRFMDAYMSRFAPALARGKEGTPMSKILRFLERYMARFSFVLA